MRRKSDLAGICVDADLYDLAGFQLALARSYRSASTHIPARSDLRLIQTWRIHLRTRRLNASASIRFAHGGPGATRPLSRIRAEDCIAQGRRGAPCWGRRSSWHGPAARA